MLSTTRYRYSTWGELGKVAGFKVFFRRHPRAHSTYWWVTRLLYGLTSHWLYSRIYFSHLLWYIIYIVNEHPSRGIRPYLNQWKHVIDYAFSTSGIINGLILYFVSSGGLLVYVPNAGTINGFRLIYCLPLSSIVSLGSLLSVSFKTSGCCTCIDSLCFEVCCRPKQPPVHRVYHRLCKR